MLALALLACQSNTVVFGTPDGENAEDTGADPLDSGIEGAPGNGDTSEDTGAAEPDPDADAAWQAGLFSDSVIHEVAITLTKDAERALKSDPYAYTAATVSFDGEEAPALGLRLRGKVGSFRELSGKPKFKLDFKEFGGPEFHGLHALALNNEVVDCSYLKEPVSARAFRDAGIPASRTGFAHVTVNGDDYGLYVIIEVQDNVFLNLNFPDDDDGNLYDGKYLYDPDTRSYTMLDFGTGVDALYQLEEGVDDGNLQIQAVSDAVLMRGDSFGETLDPLVDWEQLHRVWAVEQWAGHIDGYALNRNNYRVYFRPSDGKMVMLPWDFDYGFIEDRDWGYSWADPTGKVAKQCWKDADCFAGQMAGVEYAVGASEGEGAIDTAAMLGWYDGMVELIRESALNDPRRECSRGQVEAYQEFVRDWMEGRSAMMRGYWNL